MRENRALQLAQRRTRLEAELFVEHLLRISVRIECIRLPPAAVEREDLLPAQPLAQRMRTNESTELGDELSVAVTVSSPPSVLRFKAKGRGPTLMTRGESSGSPNAQRARSI